RRKMQRRRIEAHLVVEDDTEVQTKPIEDPCPGDGAGKFRGSGQFARVFHLIQVERQYRRRLAQEIVDRITLQETTGIVAAFESGRLLRVLERAEIDAVHPS